MVGLFEMTAASDSAELVAGNQSLKNPPHTLDTGDYLFIPPLYSPCA